MPGTPLKIRTVRAKRVQPKARKVEVRNQKNETNYRSLDKIANDPRVEKIWDEGEDGIWIQLAPGFNWDGYSCVHEWSVKDAIAAFSSVQVGSPS